MYTTTRFSLPVPVRSFRHLRIVLPAALGGLLLGGAGATLVAAVGGAGQFSDIPPGSMYEAAARELTEAGIMQGFPDGTFRPDASVTRGDLAVILQNLRRELLRSQKGRSRGQRSLLKKKSPVPPPAPPPLPSTAPQSGAKEGPALTSAGMLRFTLGRLLAQEDAGFISFTVVRTGGKRGVVTAEYFLTAGTAVSGEDYEEAAGTVTLEEGKSNNTFTIKLKDDSASEAAETLTVALRNPTGGAILGQPSAVQVTIGDDESGATGVAPPPPSGAPVTSSIAFSASAYDWAEDKGSVLITMQRLGPTEGSASISYATSDGTARAGIDYTVANGTLTFAAGEASKTFTVALANDSVMEGNKTVNLKLSAPVGGITLGTPSTALLTSVDTDLLPFTNGAFKFESSSYRSSEGDGFALITVRRVNGADGVATVQYATSDGGAKAGTDYTATSGTLTFAAGEAKKSFTVPLSDDLVSDPSEKVNLTLSNPTGGATLMDPSNAVLTIQE